MKIFFSLANAAHILWHIVLIVIFKESFYDHIADHGSLVIWAVLVIPVVVYLVWHHYKDIKRIRDRVKEKHNRDSI